MIGMESNKLYSGCYLFDKKALNNWQWNTFCKSKYTTYTRSFCRFVFPTFWRDKEIIIRRYQMRNDCTNIWVSEACHIITITSLNVVLLTGISSKLHSSLKFRCIQTLPINLCYQVICILQNELFHGAIPGFDSKHCAG